MIWWNTMMVMPAKTCTHCSFWGMLLREQNGGGNGWPTFILCIKNTRFWGCSKTHATSKGDHYHAFYLHWCKENQNCRVKIKRKVQIFFVSTAWLHPAILGKLHVQRCCEMAFNHPQVLLIMLAVLLLLLSSKAMTEDLFIQKSNIICWASWYTDRISGIQAWKWVCVPLFQAHKTFSFFPQTISLF